MGQVSVRASGSLGRSLGHFSQFLAFLELFGHIFRNFGFFESFFFDFGSILHGFRKVLQGFLAGRFADVSHFFRKLRFCVNLNKTLKTEFWTVLCFIRDGFGTVLEFFWALLAAS